ncbi:hypothetical protein CSKR_113380 [Clonorchis sinensis]|uniref:Uncharacterized protein n=1 Tax=Clonorchis sinensis TaxID=79923 RepID=A0A419Q3T0_CLOSI|nr:hypothetical protein CSKR_113380 [Clonorchis sinensis]
MAVRQRSVHVEHLYYAVDDDDALNGKGLTLLGRIPQRSRFTARNQALLWSGFPFHTRLAKSSGRSPVQNQGEL